MSPAVTARPSSAKPTTIRVSLALRSARSVLSAMIAITSEAVTMSKPVSLTGALLGPADARGDLPQRALLHVRDAP